MEQPPEDPAESSVNRDPVPSARPGWAWVTSIAIINIVWIVIGLLTVYSGGDAASLGILLLPQSLVFGAVNWGWWVSLAVIAVVTVSAAIRSRRAPLGFGWFFWKYGTVALFLSLLAGPVSLLTLLNSSG